MKKKNTLLFVALLTSLIAFTQATPVIDSTSKDRLLYEKVDKEADFPGGEQAWRKFLETNLNANVPVDNGAPVGKYTVYVQFVVSSIGAVSDVKPLTRLGYGLEREVVELIKKSGLWNPARVNNEPVNAYRKQPVTFRVALEDFDIETREPFVLFTDEENEVTIKAGNLKPQDLRVIVSKGSIRPRGDGKFIVKVPTAGRMIMQVYGKKDKKITDVSFEVRKKEG